MLVGQAVRDAQLLRQVSALHRAGGQLGLRRGPVAVGGTRREQGGYHTPPHTHTHSHSVSVPYSWNPDPAKNPNTDLDPNCFLKLFCLLNR